MLSYRHSFHAGNFADVLKHIISIEILTYLTKKDKPLCYIDTHAGAGAYQLHSAQAQKTGEYKNGISKIWPKTATQPQPVQRYLAMIEQFNATDKLEQYPGSPWIAQALLRPQDKLWLHELHPSEFTILNDNLAGDRRIKFACKDGFKNMVGLLPPPERRAFVLIDPSYEIKQDYDLVVKAILDSHKRFNQGVFALWLPVVDRYRVDEVERQLTQSGIRRIHAFELAQRDDSEEYGITP